jgi:hypothetical protein
MWRLHNGRLYLTPGWYPPAVVAAAF